VCGKGSYHLLAEGVLVHEEDKHIRGLIGDDTDDDEAEEPA